jgi:hypothetical protein
MRSDPKLYTENRLQSDLKDHVKGEHEFRNNTKWKSYHYKINVELFSHEILSEGNNLHYFTFSPNSEKPIKVLIRHLPPDTLAEDNINSRENLGSNVINVWQMKANRKASN